MLLLTTKNIALITAQNQPDRNPDPQLQSVCFEKSIIVRSSPRKLTVPSARLISGQWRVSRIRRRRHFDWRHIHIQFLIPALTPAIICTAACGTYNGSRRTVITTCTHPTLSRNSTNPNSKVSVSAQFAVKLIDLSCSHIFLVSFLSRQRIYSFNV